MLSSKAQQLVSSFFELFPKSFPNGGPPGDSFIISPKPLRREYRQLQSENHPDVLIGSSLLTTADASFSTMINKAYTVLLNPYSRIAHVIQLHHPDHIDVTQDDVSREFISQFQKSSPEASMEYKDTLMTVLEAHESLEMATLETELEELKADNDVRLQESQETIQNMIQQQWPISDWNLLIMEAIRVKYWVNIQNGIKEWEPGKPVHLTH